MVFTYGPLPILTRYSCSEVVDGNVKLGVKVVFSGQGVGDQFENILCPVALAKIGGAAGLCGSRSSGGQMRQNLKPQVIFAPTCQP